MINEEKYTLELLEGRIIRLVFKDGVEIDKDDIEQIKKYNRSLIPEGKYGVLTIALSPFEVTAEARTLASSKEYTNDRVATAFVTTSIANRLVGNFFINFNKPATPTKMFSKEEDALKWMKVQMEKYL